MLLGSLLWLPNGFFCLVSLCTSIGRIFLQIIATRFGCYIGTKNATINHTHASGVQICVEVDLNMEPMRGFPIVLSTIHCIWQLAKYEQPSFYCLKYSRQGHTSVVCRVGVKRKDDERVKGKKVWQLQNNKEVSADNAVLEEGGAKGIPDASTSNS